VRPKIVSQAAKIEIVLKMSDIKMTFVMSGSLM